jgi:hypothetical protein
MDGDHGLSNAPLAWWTAEWAAGELLCISRLRYPRTSFAFRAARYALAITMFVDDPASASGDRLSSIGIRHRLACQDEAWAQWCQDSLDALDSATVSMADETGVRAAWQWLRSWRVPCKYIRAVNNPCHRRSPCRGGPQGWWLGLQLARIAIDVTPDARCTVRDPGSPGDGC